MNIDSIIDKIITNNDQSDYDLLFELLSKSKLYFFVIDDGSFSTVDEIVYSGKNRPISLPTIKNNLKTISVLYISKKLALENLQEGFKVAHTIKGIDAVKFQYSSKEVDEIVLQGTNGHVYLNENIIKKIIKLDE